MRLAALAETALKLLASSVSIRSLKPLRLAHSCMHLLQLPLRLKLQLNFLLMGLLDHIIQGFAP